MPQHTGLLAGCWTPQTHKTLVQQFFQFSRAMPPPLYDNGDMNLDPGSIFSALLISCIGYVCFRYGKVAGKAYPLIGGIAMFIYPYFVTSVLFMWLIEAALLAGLYFLREQ
jgi:hypothetical protein